MFRFVFIMKQYFSAIITLPNNFEFSSYVIIIIIHFIEIHI